ncbi:MAG TPA: pyruvate, phosphate dikinase [Patescibacteria group bacterium]|nr:pyruvate, phosphate dikinase [Patescibacteria group bacterium]
MRNKFVYFFSKKLSEGSKEMKSLLGGKGSGLAEMASIGLPVPAGFTITTEVCELFYKNGRHYPAGLEKQVDENMRKLEKEVGKKFGDANDPLLVSVRSGAALSMPGMMETILNLGLNDRSVSGLARKTGNRRFALDAYRRFIMMYGSTAKGIDREEFNHAFETLKNRLSRKRLHIADHVKVNDTDVNESELELLVDEFKAIYKKHIGSDFPQDPKEQLWGSVDAVFGSWMAEKAVTYRRVEKIKGVGGTAVNVQQMVFGNMGPKSGTGVCFTRDPNSGENIFYGDYLVNAQGEDVVAGIRTPIKLSDFEDADPKSYEQLVEVRRILEGHFKDMQDLEFTVEEGKLYMLQCRTGKRSPGAAFKVAVDMANEKLISREDALLRIKDKDIEGIFYPIIDPDQQDEMKKNFLVSGIDAVPGAATGKVVFNAKEAEAAAAKGEKVILVRKETSPEDVGGMHAAQGILTATGGKTSHAAVVARGWGKCCIVGCEKLNINYEKEELSVGDTVVKKGEEITLNGSNGQVYRGAMRLIKPEPPASFKTLMGWVDKVRAIKVRTNADTPYDARKAVELGAEGIGLCRTEHMFFDTEERRLAIQEMIVADTLDGRITALNKLLPFQKEDFKGIFKAMDGLPVTIRLVDPPLHEFVPHTEEKQKKLAQDIGVPFEKIRYRVEQLHESNPMLGHRGCRLTITYPEILDMQVRAIIEAACECAAAGIKVYPEIMIPLTIDKKELQILEIRTRQVADEIIKNRGVKLKYLVGTMIEVPRAALLADQIAEVAEFFSFGTNDLTQMTMGISRDDAGKFLPEYVDEKKAGIFSDDPFQSLDQAGVGMLVKMAIEKGRQTKPGLKIGICGEHGGEPKSVEFCCRVGMNYVSCSPFRVPIARLAAAQAEIKRRMDSAPAKTRKAAVKKAQAAKKPSPAKKKAAPVRRAGAPKKIAGKMPAKKIKKAIRKQAPATRKIVRGKKARKK